MCEKQDKDEQRYADKYADYVKMLKNTLSKKRFTHSMNVASMCLALAKSTAVTRKRHISQGFFTI